MILCAGLQQAALGRQHRASNNFPIQGRQQARCGAGCCMLTPCARLRSHACLQMMAAQQNESRLPLLEMLIARQHDQLDLATLQALKQTCR